MERCAYALSVAYRGGPFEGWQRQTGRPTVQATLEASLTSLGIEAKLAAAGRTDAGVHARRQVVSFRIRRRLELAALLPALNARLPRSLRVLRWVSAPESFHARSSARFREYRYRISLLPTARQRFVGWTIPDPRSLTTSEIDLAAIAGFFAEQLGTHDRRRFTTRPAPGRNLTTTLFEATVRERPRAALEVRLVGDRFTRHLVRNWVGAALTVGTGGRLPLAIDGWHGIRAPGRGLILWDVGLQPDPFRTAADPPPGSRSW